MDCQSCGIPMAQDSDHGGGRPDNPYCKYCTDPTGNLKSKEEVRQGMINFQMQQSPDKTREEIEKEIDTHMETMSAWQTQTQVPPVSEPPATGTPPTTGTEPTEAPPAEEEQV